MKKFALFIFLSLVIVPLFIYYSRETPDLSNLEQIMLYIMIIVAAFGFAYGETLLKMRFRIRKHFIMRNSRNVELRRGYLIYARVAGFLAYILTIVIFIYIMSYAP